VVMVLQILDYFLCVTTDPLCGIELHHRFTTTTPYPHTNLSMTKDGLIQAINIYIVDGHDPLSGGGEGEGVVASS